MSKLYNIKFEGNNKSAKLTIEGEIGPVTHISNIVNDLYGFDKSKTITKNVVCHDVVSLDAKTNMKYCEEKEVKNDTLKRNAESTVAEMVLKGFISAGGKPEIIMRK